jgi:hypothetical protein
MYLFLFLYKISLILKHDKHVNTCNIKKNNITGTTGIKGKKSYMFFSWRKKHLVEERNNLKFYMVEERSNLACLLGGRKKQSYLHQWVKKQSCMFSW